MQAVLPSPSPDSHSSPASGAGRETPRLAYVEQAPRMLDFLVSQGIELERGSTFWPDYYDEAPGGPAVAYGRP